MEIFYQRQSRTPCICKALILSWGSLRSSSGSICLARAHADSRPFRPSGQSRSKLQRVLDSPSAVQLRLASPSPRVGCNPGLFEDVSNQTNFTVCVEGLEKLFHAGSLKEDEKARKGYKGVVEANQFTKDTKGPNAQKTKRVEAEKTTAPPRPSQPTPDKGAKRKEQEGKDGQKKPEAEGQRPLCRNFITAEGCQFGRKRRYYHPNKAGKCRVCGGESHQAKDCTRRKEPNKEPEKSKERPKSKAKAGARVATVEAEAGSASQSSALTWARAASDDCPGETSRPETAAVLEVADQLPTVMASKRSTEEKEPLLDTGASHLLMNLDHLTEEQAAEAKRIHVNQATGSPKRALLLNGVMYAADVGRVLVSVGALKERLRLHFEWTGVDPMLILEDAQGRWELFRGGVDGRLPVLTQGQFKVLFGLTKILS